MNVPHLPLKDDVKLSQNAMPFEQRLKVIQQYRDYFIHRKKTLIGYQANVGVTFSGTYGNLIGNHGNTINSQDNVIQDFWQFLINNGGDPDKSSAYPLETKLLEIQVLDYFAKLWHIENCDSLEKKSLGYWGYVVSSGTSEANTLALYNARDYLTGKPLLFKQPGMQDFKEARSENTTSHYCDERNDVRSCIPVVFFSQEAYFGHVKTLNILQLKSFNDLGSGLFPCPLRYPEDYPYLFSEELLDENGWPYAVPCEEDDTMHMPSLLKLVTAFASRGVSACLGYFKAATIGNNDAVSAIRLPLGHPPIVVFTSGSTSTGAYDNPQVAINQLVPILKHHNMYQRRIRCPENPEKFEIRKRFWFHIDGALGAGHLPFLEMAIEQGLVNNMFSNGFPVFDFRIPEIGSISLSIYKWFGLSFPASVYMMRREHQLKPLSSPVYGQNMDKTLMGSRNGQSVLLTWDMFAKRSYHDFIQEVVRAENLVLFLLEKLQQLEKIIGEDLWITRSPGSLIVSFKRPKEAIVQKYSLPSFLRIVSVQNEGKTSLQRRDCVRISIMGHVQKQHLEMILDEIKVPGAFPVQEI